MINESALPEIPSDILNQAQSIVAAHRPTNPGLKNFDPRCQLALDDFNELNIPSDQWKGGTNARSAKIDSLRTKYRNDPYALEQLDVFDPRSRHSELNRTLIKILQENPHADVSGIVDQLNEAYPLLYQQALEKKSND